MPTSKLGGFAALRNDPRLHAGNTRFTTWAAEFAALPLPAPWAAATAGLAISVLLYGAASAAVPLVVVTVLLSQAALIASWVGAMGPGSPWGLVVPAAMTAVLADGVAVWWDDLSLEGLSLVGAFSFGAAVVVQFSRGKHRSNATLAMGECVALQLAMLSLATVVVLARTDNGEVTAAAVAAAAGAGVVLAQLSDAVTRKPAFHPGVPRGLLGVILGVTGGTAVGALVFAAAGNALDVSGGASPAALGALLGGVVALITVLVDVSSGYELVGRAVSAWPGAASKRRANSRKTGRFATLPPLTAAAVAVRGPALGIAFGVAAGYVITSLLPL